MQHFSWHALFRHVHVTNGFRVRLNLAPDLNQTNQNANNKLSLFCERVWGWNKDSQSTVRMLRVKLKN